MVHKQTILMAAIGAMALCGAANADTVKVQFTGVGLGRNIQLKYAGTTQTVFAGQLKHTFSQGTGAIGSKINGSLTTFCTDILQHVTSAKSAFDVVDLALAPNPSGMGFAKADAIRNMYAYAHDQQFATANTDAAKDLAAAFQIAVWEIVYDYTGARNALDVSAGALVVKNTSGGTLSAGIRNNLTNLFNATSVRGIPFKSQYAVRSSAYQDQIVELTGVPLPGAAGMTGLGLTLAGARRRRR